MVPCAIDFSPLPSDDSDPSDIGAARIVRLDADALNRSSPLLRPDQARRYGDDRGAGLAGVYDAILGRGDDSFTTIAQEVRVLFPTIANLRLTVASSNEKVLGLKLHNGTEVDAPDMPGPVRRHRDLRTR